MTEEFRVRPMTRADVLWAIALTDTEEWGYTPQDFERLLYLEPEGALVAESRGERVGLTVAVTYGPVAYIGTVIVDPGWRGKHVGDALMNACLSFCERRGVETTRLNAYLHVVPFYERLGFRGEYENARYHGALAAGGGPAPVRPAAVEDLAAIANFDATYFGARRDLLLGRLLQEFPRHFMVASDEAGVRGYIVANASGGAAEIGPWVVEPSNREVAGELLHAVASRLGRTRIAFTIPERNPVHTRMVEELRLETAFRTLRMYRGRDAHHGNPEAIFGLAGLEKG